MASNPRPRSIYQRLPPSYFMPDSQPIPDSQPNPIEEAMVTGGSRVVPAGDSRKLSNDHLKLIVDWLEIPENFRKLHGAGTRTEVGLRHPNKKTVYAVMLREMLPFGFPRYVSNGDNLGKRFQRFEAKFKEALIFKNSIGAGVTEAELARGVTFADKLEKICPHFSRMHALYGERANVAPQSMLTFGLPGRPQLIQTLRTNADLLQEGLPGDDAYVTEDLARKFVAAVANLPLHFS